MLLFAILQLFATRATMLLPIAAIGLFTVPLVLVNVLTIDAPKLSTTMFSLDSVEAVMCSRPAGNGLYVVSAFVHPMAGKLVKNVVLPYMCGSPDDSVPPGYNRLYVGDISSQNNSYLVHAGVSKRSEKDAINISPRRIHPAFMALGLGLGVRASSSHTLSLLLSPQDIQTGRKVHRSARLSPFQNLSQPFYTGVLLPLQPRARWIWINTLLKATAIVVLVLIAPFLDAPLARLECKLGLHPENGSAQEKSTTVPSSVILDSFIPSNGEPWTMLRAPEPLSDRRNVYTWVDGMSKMEPIYSKTTSSVESLFLFVNREDNTNFIFAVDIIPLILQSANVPPASGASPWLYSPQTTLLPFVQAIGSIKRSSCRGRLLSPPLSRPPTQPTLPAQVFYNISAVQFPALAFLDSFNLSRLRLTRNAIGLEIMDQTLEEANSPSLTLIETVNDILEVDRNSAHRTEEAGDETIDNAPTLMSPTTPAIYRLPRKPKMTSLLKRDRRKRFFQLWLRAGLKKKNPSVTLETMVNAFSDDEDEDEEVFDYLSPTGLRQKSTPPASEVKVDGSSDHEQDDDDDEVFDYLSPTGLCQRSASGHDLSLVSSDDSTLSCCSDWGLYSSTHAIRKALIEDSVSCDIGDLFAPDSPVIAVSLSRRESFETTYVLDIGDSKGYDTDALFQGASSTITVNLSSSSSLNQPSKTVSPTKIKQKIPLGAPRLSTVVNHPPGTFSLGPTLDFVELFMSIYCKDQSLDRSLSSSIHAPGNIKYAA